MRFAFLCFFKYTPVCRSCAGRRRSWYPRSGNTCLVHVAVMQLYLFIKLKNCNQYQKYREYVCYAWYDNLDTRGPELLCVWFSCLSPTFFMSFVYDMIAFFVLVFWSDVFLDFAFVLQFLKSDEKKVDRLVRFAFPFARMSVTVCVVVLFSIVSRSHLWRQRYNDLNRYKCNKVWNGHHNIFTSCTHARTCVPWHTPPVALVDGMSMTTTMHHYKEKHVHKRAEME